MCTATIFSSKIFCYSECVKCTPLPLATKGIHDKHYSRHPTLDNGTSILKEKKIALKFHGRPRKFLFVELNLSPEFEILWVDI